MEKVWVVLASIYRLLGGDEMEWGGSYWMSMRYITKRRGELIPYEKSMYIKSYELVCSGYVYQ